ncbi:Do/DeqQ family serine protease [Desulfotomaculum arcticum]|uniref:Do/DeqQ family serine protease n=1 Tax=Desulfotruncus arcticus DSM 17038 TaxID=1121424 RepID=A0A1I2N868_9FIRM|nr:trypsin-like peptidase domain-containing protein [Desulfotruncus arcticus]SFF99059.1 Do/DeqQ family serine protease [Desulfotomaculum arcticum] [Desulfotruncus arcticus DSM 17038]
MFKDNPRRALILAVIAAVVIEIALLGGIFSYFNNDRPAMAAESTSTTQPLINSSPIGTNVVANVVEQTSKSVVKIETTEQVQSQRSDPFFNDPFFRQFFGNQGPMYSQPNIQKGMGSGFIISDDGYILTNEHVIDGATDIKVYLSDSENPLSAKVIGSDSELDLAVLKIDAGKKLPYISLGDSDAARVGEWVIAIGNPYGLDHTVTTGVISAKSRPVQVEDRQYKNLLQTDASINPGNSGGPLLNLAGQVIGINTAVNAQAQGIGFAIPSSTVKSVLDTLIQKGKISRPYMGVYIQTLTADLASQLNLNSKQGAIIAGIVPDSPADKAGLKQGDIVLEINKQKVTDAANITDLIQKSKVGSKVTLLIESNGSQRYVTVTLVEK